MNKEKGQCIRKLNKYKQSDRRHDGNVHWQSLPKKIIRVYSLGSACMLISIDALPNENR